MSLLLLTFFVSTLLTRENRTESFLILLDVAGYGQYLLDLADTSGITIPVLEIALVESTQLHSLMQSVGITNVTLLPNGKFRIIGDFDLTFGMEQITKTFGLFRMVRDGCTFGKVSKLFKALFLP